MNKDEILKMARSENQSGGKDEREKVIFDKSFYWCYFFMIITAVVFVTANELKHQPANDLLAMIYFSCFGAFLYRLKKNRGVMNLICALIMLLSAIIYTVRFFTESSG